jgi:hypothetical protein
VKFCNAFRSTLAAEGVAPRAPRLAGGTPFGLPQGVVSAFPNPGAFLLPPSHVSNRLSSRRIIAPRTGNR